MLQLLPHIQNFSYTIFIYNNLCVQVYIILLFPSSISFCTGKIFMCDYWFQKQKKIIVFVFWFLQKTKPYRRGISQRSVRLSLSLKKSVCMCVCVCVCGRGHCPPNICRKSKKRDASLLKLVPYIPLLLLLSLAIILVFIDYICY